MKKLYLTLAFIFLIVYSLVAQTTGKLEITTTTSSTGGNFEPENIVAIWIEDGSGSFIKTLLVYAQNQISHLNTWQASTNDAGSEYNSVDAITGPTQSEHGTRSAVWNGEDFNGTVMPDGSYTLRMELTDKNATGNFSSFDFTKGPNSQMHTPADVASFSAISILWTPSTIAGFPEIEKNDISVYPNPGTGIYRIRGNNIIEVEVKTLTGKTVFKDETKLIDITKQPKGTYIILIKTTEKTLVNKLIKN